MIWVAVVAVLAVLVGLTASVAVRRRGANSDQAMRNWRVLNAIVMLVVAAVLLSIGITEEHRRYVNVAIAAALAAYAIWQLRIVRRETGKS